MRDHEAMKDQLFALYDEELVGADRREVEAHLAACPECHRIYAQWQQTASVLFRPPHVQASEAFVHRLMERLDALGRPHRPAPWMMGIRWLVPALGLVGLLLLLIGPTRDAVSVETLLLADGRERGPTQLVLVSGRPSTDEVLGAMMEGQP